MPAANAQDISGLVLPANSGAIGGQDKAAEMQRICRQKGLAARNRRNALAFVIAHFFPDLLLLVARLAPRFC